MAILTSQADKISVGFLCTTLDVTETSASKRSGKQYSLSAKVTEQQVKA